MGAAQFSLSLLIIKHYKPMFNDASLLRVTMRGSISLSWESISLASRLEMGKRLAWLTPNVQKSLQAPTKSSIFNILRLVCSSDH